MQKQMPLRRWQAAGFGRADANLRVGSVSAPNSSARSDAFTFNRAGSPLLFLRQLLLTWVDALCRMPQHLMQTPNLPEVNQYRNIDEVNASMLQA